MEVHEVHRYYEINPDELIEMAKKYFGDAHLSETPHDLLQLSDDVLFDFLSNCYNQVDSQVVEDDWISFRRGGYPTFLTRWESDDDLRCIKRKAV